ncbi:hypothetical protein KAW64_08720, partial [bacterium]|nr:hypothetical protein [bacterium]
MTHTRTSSTHLLSSHTLVILLACAVVLAAPAAAQAQDAVPVPVALAAGVELQYDIPLQPWLVPTVLDLKTQFADGLSAEFNGIAEDQTGEDLTALVEAGRELGDSTVHMMAAVRAIGELDVTFGIGGISRIIPAESAIRDTLFAFVVWHEFSSTPARGMMRRFESLVNRVTAGGDAVAGFSAELAADREHLEQAVTQGNLGRIAELSPGIIETSVRIDAVCGTVAAGAQELSALIDSLSIDSAELLVERWAEASRAAAHVGEPAQRTGPALESMSDVLHILVELGGLLDVAETSVNAMRAAPDVDGNLYIPWAVMKSDWELAHDLRGRVIGESAGQAATGEHDGEYVGQAATQQTKARIGALLVHQVDANAILAERAVEHTSTSVAEAVDTLEEFYLDRAGYSDDLKDRRKAKVFQEVDGKLRENLELGSAKISIKSARAALALGRAYDARGAGSEIDAL